MGSCPKLFLTTLSTLYGPDTRSAPTNWGFSESHVDLQKHTYLCFTLIPQIAPRLQVSLSTIIMHG